MLSEHLCKISIGVCIVVAYAIYMITYGGDGYLLSTVIASLVALIIGGEAYSKIKIYKNQVDTLLETITELRREK